MTYHKMQTDLFRYFLNGVGSPASAGVEIIYLLESSTRQKSKMNTVVIFFLQKNEEMGQKRRKILILANQGVIVSSCNSVTPERKYKLVSH